ncbi:reverse transcriptase [Gossypium australe]|uniref:Reverse transcriptase n=1 Tax=Gossypium australe TaxID=47621 RepID=A0A5B6VVD3_9ROSI|nr:reverse transcriptase [Gossypium australe]
MMTRMGFDELWIQLIMNCISTISYPVVLNGVPRKAFTPERGLRQGDPLSPFLFLVCSEGLSTLLRLTSEKWVLRWVKASRRSPQITHLLFTDDCVLFGEATEKGQCVNYRKSTMFFSSNTIDTVQSVISNRLGVKRSNNFKKYLGLPNMVGKRRRLAFQHLKDRIKMKIDNWRRKRSFHKNCFTSNSSLHNGMLSITKINILCELKEFGGIGYRNFAKFNLALIAKQGWRLIENLKSLLAQTLKAKYHLNSDFLNSELGNLPSYTWKSIWAVKGLLLTRLCWKVGNGRDIRIEDDIWVPNAEGLHIQQMVKRQNITRLIRSTFSREDAQKILQIPLAHTPHDDFLAWRGESTGEYTVRSGYKLLLHGNFLNDNRYNPIENRKC